MKKVDIYVRVSTRDKGQDTENQVGQLKSHANKGVFQLRQIHSDNESGQKGRLERKAFDQMLKDAKMRKFDVLMFWSLDRFSREGTLKTLHYLQLLDDYGVKFISHTEEYLNTDSDLVRGIIIPMMSYFAKLEVKKISERTTAGLENKLLIADPGKYEFCENCEYILNCKKKFKYCKKQKRTDKKRIGKQSMADLGIDRKIVYLQNADKTDTEIMTELNISRNTVKKYKVKDEDH